MNNNHHANNVHVQSNFTEFFNNETGNLQTSTNDVIQAEHPSSSANYNGVNASYSNSRYTGFSTMDGDNLSPPYAYTPVMSSNYIAISDSNEQQSMSTSLHYIDHANEAAHHIHNIPISLNMNANFPGTNHPEIFRFDIPGFQIVVIPVSPINNLNMQNQFQHNHTYLNYTSSNINDSQTQFQQSNYHSFR